MNKKLANLITGGLSNPKKMPGKGYSIPAKHCKTGGKLREVEGSVCSKCYAMKGNYARFKNVADSLEYRFQSLSHPDWVEAMATLIKDEEYFRWHDSGDIQSYEHLDRIVRVALKTSKTKHWLPTKERFIVHRWLDRNGSFPPNLVVRWSHPMVNPEYVPRRRGYNTCSSHTKDGKAIGKVCPAPLQGGICGDCRKCWDKRVRNVSYEMH